MLNLQKSVKPPGENEIKTKKNQKCEISHNQKVQQIEPLVRIVEVKNQLILESLSTTLLKNSSFIKLLLDRVSSINERQLNCIMVQYRRVQVEVEYRGSQNSAHINNEKQTKIFVEFRFIQVIELEDELWDENEKQQVIYSIKNEFKSQVRQLLDELIPKSEEKKVGPIKFKNLVPNQEIKMEQLAKIKS